MHLTRSSSQRKSPLRPAGYTAIEMMTVLAIVSVMLAIAVPNFYGLIQHQRMSTTTNQLFSAITLARSEAIDRGLRVDLVPASDGGWESGWTVFIDQNGNQKVDSGEHVVLAHGPVVAGMTIKAAFTDAKVPYLAYTASGRTRTNANSQTPQVGSWSLTLGDHSRRIVINFLGRPRVCTPNAGAVTC